jgi:TRAP-type C4-dicarboxylate transport system substrate-binding protein
MRRWLAVCFTVFFITGIVMSFFPTAAVSKTINWNLSLWSGKRAWTKPVHVWADAMEKKTNGQWKIKIHYGGVLAPPKENWDGLKAGMFEAAAFCAAYTPGKIPLHTVQELPFMAPDGTANIAKMWIALWEHPAMKKELLKWNAVPLLPAGHAQFQLMGNKKITKVSDLKGVRIRAGGEIAKVLKEFGAVPTLLPAPEVFEAIDRGTIDLVAFPYSYAFGSFKVYEVSKYAMDGISLGTMGCAYVANKDAWDALPDEFKKIHMEWYKQAPQVWDDEYVAADKKWIPIFKKNLDLTTFPASERAKLVAKAQGIYDKWVAAREKAGLPGKEILEYYLKKRKEITGK